MPQKEDDENALVDTLKANNLINWGMERSMSKYCIRVEVQIRVCSLVAPDSWDGRDKALPTKETSS